MGVGIVCHGLSGRVAEIGDDGINFWLRKGVSELEGCEMEVLEWHKPEIWDVLVTGSLMGCGRFMEYKIKTFDL